MSRAAAGMLLVALAFAALPSSADHLEHVVCPAEPTRDFPTSFRAPVDRQAEICSRTANPWSDLHVGGWGGGECAADHVARTPVVFVHGQGVDGWYFNAQYENADGSHVNVRQRFLDAGYCAGELWAVTYSGDATPARGTSASYNTYNDIQAEEVYEFIRAVRDFVGAPRVDVIGHSLGVTVVRKGMFLHRNDPAATNPYTYVRRAVMIAGANHGTSTCRGEENAAALHVCEEVTPGDPWLAELNAPGEAPGPTHWITVCDCTGVADQFYVAMDAESPLLDGAEDVRLPGTNHLALASSAAAVATYLPLLVEGSAEAAAAKPAEAPDRSTGGKPRVLAARPGRGLPATGVGNRMSVGVVLLGSALAIGLVARRRRA